MTQDIQSINELKSYTEYNVSTPTSVFTIGFQYEYNVDKINVHVDGIEATAAGYTVQHDSQGTVTLVPAVPTGVVRVFRETDIDTSAHTFSAGAKFTAGNMDEGFKQLRHAQQEVRDRTTRTVEQFTTLNTNATAALNAANTAVNTANSIDAKASTALSNANTAVSTANSANSTANTALSTANGIDAKATTALSDSSTAVSTANSALSTANGIDAKATQAQLDASTALSTVTTQKGAANGIATLDANAVVPVAQLPTASATNLGLIQVATQAEVNTGLNSARAIVPNTLLGGIKTHLNATGSAPIYACRAWVNFNGAQLNGTYSQAGTTVTVTMTAHGMSVGQNVNLTIASGTAVSGSYTVETVADANTFTYTAGTNLTTSGSVARNTFVRASGNVSSITDNGIGYYKINFASAMPDANYAVCGAGAQLGEIAAVNPVQGPAIVNPSTNSFEIYTGSDTTAKADWIRVCLSVFR